MSSRCSGMRTRATTEGGVTTTTTYTYDKAGRLTQEVTGTATYTYDVRNRQISYLSGTTAAVYTYHPDNLRKTKTVNGATTNFVWADENLVHEFTNTSTKTYFYAIILVSDSAGQNPNCRLSSDLLLHHSCYNNDAGKKEIRWRHGGQRPPLSANRCFTRERKRV